MWKNIVKRGRPQMTIRVGRIRLACWVTNAKNAHSEYVIIIVFPQQQWLHERTLMYRYTYIACLNLSVNIVYKSETFELYPPLQSSVLSRYIVCYEAVFLLIVSKTRAKE
jgi:hypothetical protein